MSNRLSRLSRALCTTLTASALVISAVPEANAGATRRAARDQIDKIFTSAAEVRRICTALEGADPARIDASGSGPLADKALDALKAEHVDDAMLLASELLGDSNAGALLEDVAKYIDSGEASPALRSKAAAYATRAKDAAPPRVAQILSALDQAGIDNDDLLAVLRHGPRALDTSEVIVRMALRLAQGTHERVDQFSSGLPWGLGGVVGWLTEMVLGELLAIGVVYAVQRVEERSYLAKSTEVARRACKLIEQDATRPVLASRMLRQLVVRLSSTPNPGTSSIALHCTEHPGRCARLARRWGIRNSDLKIATRGQFKTGGFFAIDGWKKLVDLRPSAVRARLADNSAKLDLAMHICDGESSCSFAQINYALSIVMLQDVEGTPSEVPIGDVPRDCPDCCDEPHPEPEPVPDVVCRRLSPGEPADVAVLLDRSGSTLRRIVGEQGTRRTFETLGDHVRRIANDLSRDGAELSIWSFPDGTRRCEAPRGPNVATSALDAHLTQRPGRTYTPLRATLEALRASRTEPNAARSPLAVVVVSDGEFNCKIDDPLPWRADHRGVARAARDLREAGVTIHAVLLDGQLQGDGRRRRLSRSAVAALSGAGTVTAASNPEEVAARLQVAAREARCSVEVGRASSVAELRVDGARISEWRRVGDRIQLTAGACDALVDHRVVELCEPSVRPASVRPLAACSGNSSERAQQAPIQRTRGRGPNSTSIDS